MLRLFCVWQDRSLALANRASGLRLKATCFFAPNIYLLPLKTYGRYCLQMWLIATSKPVRVSVWKARPPQGWRARFFKSPTSSLIATCQASTILIFDTCQPPLMSNIEIIFLQMILAMESSHRLLIAILQIAAAHIVACSFHAHHTRLT